MKNIDFSFSGGFPLTQETLNYLQTAYTEALVALTGYRKADTDIPVRLSGIIIAGSLPTTISDGWLLYNGELIRIPATSYTVIPLGYSPYFVRTVNTTNLTYNDASTHPAIVEVTGVLTMLVNTTPNDSTHIKISSIQDFCRETNYTDVNFSSYVTGLAATGTISYKKDYLSNSLMLKGTLSIPSAIALAANAGKLDYVDKGTLMLTLPSGHRPSTRASFIVDISGGSAGYSGVIAADSTSTYTMFFENFTGIIDTNGKVYIKFLDGLSEPVTHYFDFNCVIPLD